MHALEQPQADQVGKHARSAVGHEREWNTGHRHQPHRHANVLKGLEGKPGDHANTYQSPKDICRSRGDGKGSNKEEPKEQQDEA